MIGRHTLLYVGSRAVAAALSLVSLAVFTRLAPLETYGTYLLILSWALVLYGITCQWPRFAYFALYEEARAPAQTGTLARLLLGCLGIAAGVSAGAAALGLASPRLALGVTAATAGMVVFEGTLEIARTRLLAGVFAVAIIARSVLMLAFGSAALIASGDPLHFTLALALAQALAAIPAGLDVWPMMLRGHGSRAEARRLLAYGWPLVLSFGITALAQTIDRLIIGRAIGAQELGAYGAVGDFLRQSFVVFGDSVALSTMSIAKRDARAGGMEAAGPVLRDAARALALIGAFGAVFFLSFDAWLMSVLLGPGYREAAVALAPYLIAASVAMLFRAYYFGQVIYFTKSSGLDAVASLVLLAATGGLSLALIPVYGVVGAAVALAAGQVCACLAYVLGSRGRARMPVPAADLGLIFACALAAYLGLALLDRLPPPWLALAVVLKLALIGLCAAGTAWHFDIVGVRGGLARTARRIVRRAA